MNGAEKLARRLAHHGVDLCLANPGTSEMHFLAALDAVPEIRPVLVLHETVATGAADGYARMTGRPAATLLHLGPGLANGLSNLHNASRALSPIINIVGDHATDHRALDAPLTSDIEGIARTVGRFTRTIASAGDCEATIDDAVNAARNDRCVVTVILPADAAWSDVNGDAEAAAIVDATEATPLNETLERAVRALQQEGAVLYVGYDALRGPPLELIGKVATRTGARLISQTTNPVIERGAGRVPVMRLPFAPDAARDVLRNAAHIVLLGAKPPVAFFAQEGKPGRLWRDGADLVELCSPHGDIANAAEMLCAACDAHDIEPNIATLDVPDLPSGPLNAAAVGQALAALLPENAIVVDEAMTNGVPIAAATRSAQPHDWLQNMGGSIGYGPPAATGCALACPDRRVVCLEGDGSAMYTIQALWTQAREKLNVTTIILANRSYAILAIEAERMSLQRNGRAVTETLHIGHPDLDFCLMARGMGVSAVRVTTTDALCSTLETAFSFDGPMLIEVVL